MKKFIVILACAMMAVPTFAGEKNEPKSERGKAIKEAIQGHFKFYGFVRNYFTFDTRESKAGTGDLFYYVPLDENWNISEEEAAATGVERFDINATPSFRFLSLTSRLGLDMTGYKFGNMELSGKIEADFYAGLSAKATAEGKPAAFPNATNMSGVAQFRLRQAYMTLAWKDLPMGKDQKASVALKMGQAWHPVAADQPHVFSLETGAPFNAFARTPQVTMDATLGKNIILSGSLLWQMQYLSTGPNGASADYMKYGCTPEAYLGLSFKHESGILMRVGASILSIKPRALGEKTVEINGDEKTVKVKVSDRITTVTPYFYFQYVAKNIPFQLKAKTIYSSAGEHINMLSGYGVTEKFDDGHWAYTPMHTSATWASLSYGKKWQFMFMAGYIQNLGANKDMVEYWFSGNATKKFHSEVRAIPAICYNINKFFSVGLEYNISAARYGATVNAKGVPSDLHWVYNNRIQAMVKFTF